MGLFKLSPEQKQRRAETKAYRQILKKKTTQASRQAFSEEAEKVAIEKAKARARRPSFGETLLSGVSKIGAPKPQARASPVKRRKRTVRRRTPVVRRKRRTVRRRTPVVRRKRRTVRRRRRR